MGNMMFTFITFTTNNQRLFHQYLKIKYDIFISEFCWESLPCISAKGLALEDKFDKTSVFIACIYKDNLIGALRLSHAGADKPYSALYKQYLSSGLLNKNYAVINGVAVKSEFRGQPLGASLRHTEYPVTIGHRLIQEACSLAEHKQDLVLTAGYKGSANFFTKVGFQVMGEKYKPDWSPTWLVDCFKKRAK
jgi:predicted GNAT family N-acyltransferase